LCKRQVKEESIVDQQAAAAPALEGPLAQSKPDKGIFRLGIINKCQSTFLGATTSDEQIKQAQEELDVETDEGKKALLTEKIDTLKSKEKRRLLGLIKFIAQLYRLGLLVDSIINWCVVELVKRHEATGDDIYIEYAVSMIETVGPTYDRKRKSVKASDTAPPPPPAAAATDKGRKTKAQHKGQPQQQQSAQPPPAQAEAEAEPIEKIFSHLSTLKAKLSNRVRFMIMDLEDLRKNDWKSRRGNAGPKKIEEVRLDVEKEIEENQAERDAYDRKNAMMSGGRKQSQRPLGNYQGRGSQDNRQQQQQQPQEKRLMAAQASSATSSSIRKDTNLAKAETQKLGLGRTSIWASSTRKSELSMVPNTERSAPSPPTGNTPASTPPPQPLNSFVAAQDSFSGNPSPVPQAQQQDTPENE